ncbi:hypothetical protein [Vibrio metschnikovii]|uniref:hypothetical protein n=1 Tax=Vibrio metschnikovii TaxID=28172 RepID=UPI001CC9E7A2|nr:hypothetical protein [Vibrio metschnikovii]
MKYNTITVHCASLCLDVLNQGHFFRYTTPDILAFEPEVKIQIRVRLEPVSSVIQDEEGMIKALASGVINVLLHYHFTAERVSPDLIMDLIQHRLDNFLKSGETDLIHRVCLGM